MKSFEDITQIILSAIVFQRRRLRICRISILLSIVLASLGIYANLWLLSFIGSLGFLGFIYAIFLKHIINRKANDLAGEFFFSVILEAVKEFMHYYDDKFDKDMFLDQVKAVIRRTTIAQVRRNRVYFIWELFLGDTPIEVRAKAFTYSFQLICFVDQYCTCASIPDDKLGVLFRYKIVWHHGNEIVIEDYNKIYLVKP